MDDDYRDSTSSEHGGLFTKVIGGGLVLLLLAAVRFGDDIGRVAVRAGSHAGAPVEQAVMGGADETWRAIRSEAAPSAGTQGSLAINRATIDAIDHARGAAPIEQAAAREGAESGPETLPGRTADVVKEAAQEVVQQDIEIFAEEDSEELNDKR